MLPSRPLRLQNSHLLVQDSAGEVMQVITNADVQVKFFNEFSSLFCTTCHIVNLHLMSGPVVAVNTVDY